MPLRKTIQDLVVRGRQFLGPNNDQSIGFDPNRGANGALVITDEQNTTEQAAIPVGSTLADALASGGASEIPQDALQPQTPSGHAADHQAGGPDPLLVEDLDTTATDTSIAFKPDGSGGVTAGVVGTSTGEIQEIALSTDSGFAPGFNG